MFDGSLINRRRGVVVLVLVSAWLLSPATAKSEPDRLKDERAACLHSYKRAQQLEESGRLREARESLLSCAQPACGTFVQQDCSSRYIQIGADIPSVVPVVTDESGAPRGDVAVHMDGDLLTGEIDGRALTVNPGLHEFSFTADGVVFDKQKVLIVQGQRNRLISASWRTPHKRPVAHKKSALTMEAPAPRAPEPDPSVLTSALPPADAAAASHGGGGHGGLALALGLGGVAAAGAGGMLVYWGRADNALLAQCSPGCPQASVEHVRRMYLAGDIAMGVGAAALIGAYWALVLGPSTSGSGKEDGERARGLQAYRLDVQPARSGAVATIAGSF